jgi:hypothetical protein
MERDLQRFTQLAVDQGRHMRYLAIVLLSLTVLLRAAGSSAGAGDFAAHVSLALPAVSETMPVHDGALATLLGGALVALQLRRRQKSLRQPRAFHGR